VNKTPFKILLCIPPAYDRIFPPLGTPAIAGFLKSKGIAAFQEDLNIGFFEYIKRNKLEFLFTEKYKNDKIKNRVYYYRDLKYRNRECLNYAFQRVPGAAFDFTEKLLSSKNLLKYIDDEKENIYHKFFRHETLARIKTEKFNMVGFSITAPSQVIPAFTFGRIIKSELPDVKVVIGGQWASLFKEELGRRDKFSAFYDYIIYFEGETPLYSLINCLTKDRPLARVPNLIYLEKGKFVLSEKVSAENMDNLPCPDFDGLPLRKYSSSVKGKTCSLTFETSRGCYWNRCTFCVDLPLPKPGYREKNINLLMNDIKTLKRKYKANNIIVSNAVFHPGQMEKFSRELIRRKIKIRWWTMARLEKEFTKELLGLVKKAGCVELSFGLESMSQRVLDFCDKGTRTEIVKRIVADAMAVKLKTCFQIIIGLPGETARDVLDTIYFLLNHAEEPAFNNYYLTPNNYVFVNPGKYGVEFRKCRKLPFRFFYPFRHTLVGIDKYRAEQIIKFYNLACDRSRGTPALPTRNISPRKLEFNKLAGCGKLAIAASRHEELRRYDKAVHAYKKILKIFPDLCYPYVKLGRNYFNLKKYDQAIKAINRAIGSGYEDGNVYFLLGYCYQQIKQYKKAIETLKKAEKLNPEEAQINFSLSKCYRNIGQAEQADKELDKGLIKIQNLGRALEENRMPDEK
jgi:radical SAM superfamily enzyme YgiQ (UPF0313 family)